MRSLAKPVSNIVKSTVKSHPAFRRLAVGGARLHARTNARWDRLVRRRPTVDKKGNPIQRRELTENEAIDLAADIIGEGFLLYLSLCRELTMKGGCHGWIMVSTDTVE